MHEPQSVCLKLFRTVEVIVFEFLVSLSLNQQLADFTHCSFD